MGKKTEQPHAGGFIRRRETSISDMTPLIHKDSKQEESNCACPDCCSGDCLSTIWICVRTLFVIILAVAVLAAIVLVGYELYEKYSGSFSDDDDSSSSHHHHHSSRHGHGSRRSGRGGGLYAMDYGFGGLRGSR